MSSPYDAWVQNSKAKRGNVYDKWVENSMQQGTIAPQQEDEGLGTIGWNAFKGGAAGVGAGIASFIHADDTAQYLQGIVNNSQRRRDYDSVLDANYWTDPYGAYYDILNGLGSMAALAPTAAIPGGAVGGTIAKFAPGLLGRLGLGSLGKMAAGKAGQAALSTFGRGATTGAFESVSEGGSARQEAIAQGLDNPDEIALKTAAANLPTLMLSNGLEYALLGGKLFNPAGKAGESIGKRAAMAIPRMTPAVAANAAQNGVEELLQQTYSDYFMGKPVGNVFNPGEWTPDQWKAMQTGAVVGGALSGASGAYHSMGIRPNEQPDNEAYEQPPTRTPQDYSNIDLSDIPMQDIEDVGLANTNNTLKANFRQLFDWANDTFGKQVEVSGGARSEEHNREVNGSPTSHHLHGNAIDVNVSMLTDAEREAFIQKAAAMGFNADGDDFYHDRGSGYHVHLTYADNGNVSDSTSAPQQSKTDMSSLPMGNIAQMVHNELARQGYNLPAEWIWAQMMHETGGPNPDYDLANIDHNYAGIKVNNYETQKVAGPAPDGGDYRHFDSDEDYAAYQARNLIAYADTGIFNSQSLDDMARALASGGYYTNKSGTGPATEEDIQNYIGGMKGALSKYGVSESGGGSGSSGGSVGGSSQQAANTPQVGTEDSTYEEFAKTWMREGGEEERNVFEGMFTKNGKFLNTEENRRIIDEEYGEEFKAWQEEEQNPSVQKQIQRHIEKAVADKDYNRFATLQAALSANDVDFMQKYLEQAKGQQTQATPQPAQSQPVQNQPAQSQSVQNQPVQSQATQNQLVQNQPVQNQPVQNQLVQNQPAWQGANHEETARTWAVDAYRDGTVSYDEAVTRLNELKKRFYTAATNKEKQQIQQTTQALMDELNTIRSQQEGVNANGSQSTESTEAPAPQAAPVVNQNQNAEPGQAEAQEPISQPVQQEVTQAQPAPGGLVNTTYTTKKGEERPAVTWEGRIDKDEFNRRKELSKQYNGWWNNKTKTFAFRNEQDRDAFVAVVNGTPAIEATSMPTSMPVQEAPQEVPKKDSKALSQFKKNMAKVVKDYRKDKITYEEAYQTVVSAQDSAERVAPDSDTREAIQDVARNTIMELNAIYKEKNGHEFGEAPSQTAQEAAGTQGQAQPNEVPAQGKAEPVQGLQKTVSDGEGESAPKNEDYHGYLDDKQPGAVAEIRKQLEKKDTSFGTGLLTTKHIMERWAETDETNQSQQKGKTYYVHGNKVSKVVWEYYNHLILKNYMDNVDKEEAEPVKTRAKQEAAKEQNKNKKAATDGGQEVTQKDSEPKQEKPLPVSYAERKSELKKAFESAAYKGDMSGTVEAVQSYVNRMVSAMKSDMDKLANRPDLGVDLDTYLTGFDSFAHMIDDVMTPGALSVFNGDQKRQIKGRVRDAVEAARGELKKYKNTLSKQEKPAETENNTVKADGKEESSNEQQGESGSLDGGHEGVRTRESGSDQREEAGGVSEHDGRKGKGHGSDNVKEHSEEPQPAGVRAGAELDSAASTGTDKRGNQSDVPLTEAQAHPSPTETPGHNYEIKENEGDPNKRNADVRYKQNIDAIKLLRQLEDEERMATPAEQKILAQYNGWGGLTSKFKEGSETDKELRSLLSAEEYRDAQRSSLSAYYTPPKIVKAIWAGLSHLGFKGGRILDPAMGVGNFFGCMPKSMMAKSVLDGVEMESLTARLARQLYPDADVQNTAFQRSNTPKNFYDLVITNVPFEQTIVNGYQVHNYYFAAGIDKVRPGGLMVYITGQGSLSGGSDAARMRTYLNKEADLIGAFKLPSGVFDATNVGTDVVVFQKRIDGKKSPHGQDFTNVQNRGSYGVNTYFMDNRDNVLGEMSVGTNRFGQPELNVRRRKDTTNEDVAKDLEAAMKKLPKNVYEPVSRNNSKPFNPSETAKRAKADEKTRDREYYYKDGKIVQNQDGRETEIKGKQAEVVKSYVKLKNSLNALLAAETDPKATDKQVESLRDMLNRDYNDFVKKHGYLHGANKRHFADDPSSGMVQSLETPIETEEKTKSGATKKKVTGAKKASIFSERSTNPKKEVTHVDTASDALVASLNNTGRLDLEYMAKLTGKTQEKLLSELKGTVFKDPATENFVTKDEYLSGNVREKLILVKEMAKRDKSYAANVKALEEVQPEELVPEEIFVSLGTPWIPAQDVNNFVHTIANGKFTVHYNSALAKWTVTGWLNSTKFGTQHIAFEDFLTKVLNGQVIEIKYTDEDKKTHVDEAATKAVTAEAERLQAEFKEWIWKDKERAKRLTDYYNANFNNYVLREYDGSHLDPHEHGMNAKITLKPHQKDAVWRILQSGNTLLAHCVGAGKTFEMQTAGMEMRRLGMANKPMYLVPLNVVDQFAKDFRRLYPGAKLLVLTNDDLPQVKLTKKVTKTDDGRIEITDLTKDMSAKEKERIAKNKAKRARTLARIRTEDWDGIIMSHTLFKELPVSPETQTAYMEEEFKRLEAALKEAKQTDSLDGRAKRTLEEQKAKLQEKMEEARSVDVKDLGITFEQLGIDQLFVDEADLFKNLHFTSSKTSNSNKIKGITNPQADYKHRAFDMFLKTQWLSKMLNGRGVVFATGTPISNSMAELYTMMRYLDPQGLKEHGTELFDSWIGVFGDIGQDTQLNSTGTNWETVTKVRSYNNRPELLKMFRKFADIKQPSDLPDIQRPNLKGGKPTIIELPVDPAVSRYLKERVPKRIGAMSGGFKKQKGEDNMLALMNDLRNLSLSDSKIEACADTIVSEYKDSTPVKGTQLVFCDLGIPKAASEKEDANDDGPSKKVSEIANPDVYRKLIEKLVKKGIPREQIAFIQDYPKEKRQAVFEKVNNGEIRILIGSTTAMGAGTNCQKHLVALHDLDAPWRPRDLEQRHGRILRQGNENSEVSIYQYALKGSFDAVIWSKLKEKALLIELAMSSDMNSRSMEEADIITLEYSEMVGASLDDPLMKEKVDTENELSKVRNAQTEFSKKVQRATSTLETIDDKIEAHQKAVEHIKKDIAGRKSTRGDNFSMTVGDKTFTKRDDAGNAIEARLKDFDESKPTVVGSLGGFALKAVKTITGIEMEVVGKHAYPVKTISVQGLENTVNVQVDDTLEKEEAYLDYLNQQKKDALDIQGQENPYAEKVKSLEEKLADLNRQIKERAVEESKKQNDTETEEAQGEKTSSNRKYSLDGSDSVTRSMGELKAEVIEAFPGAKVQEGGNKLTFTMPNGQKVTVTLHDNLTATDEELSKAKREHGIDQRVTVTVEGYAEAVDGEGFGALSQGSRKGTGFHEAYHIAEAIAFTKKELADAKRLISDNEEKRADAYAKWKLERKKHSNFAKLWQKIADVAAKLAGILGYETKRNIFRKVESGEIYQRDNTARNLSRKYSIDASDNSKESLIHRAKNFFSKSRAADTPEYRRMLKGMMEEIAGIKIRYGKMSEDSMEAVYDSFKKVIRAKSANDWENVLPLFAEATCEKLGIKPSDELSAYISDWIQTGAPNNNSAEAETFARAMREHPEIGDQLLDLQEAFQRWDKMNAMERGQSVISYQHKEKTTLSEKATEVYTQFVEELNPVMNLVQEIEKKHGKLRISSNPYEAFRLFRGYKGRAMALIEGNTKAISDVMAHWYPNLNWEGFKSIHAILDSVGALHDKKTREEFSAYCLACHVYDIHKANDLTTMEVERLSGELANASEEKQEEIKQKIERLNKTIMDTPLSRTDCGEIIRGHKQKYGKAQQDLVHYSNMTLAILKDSGMISERRYNNILKKWPNYVPMFRVFDDNGKIQFGDSMKALTGSRRDVIDPLESIIRNTFDFVRKAEKNKAKCLLARLAQMSDVGKYIDPVDNPSPDDKTTITYYVDGQKRYLQTDPAVVTAVNGMGLDSSNMYRSLFRLPSAFARSAFTIMDLTFIVRNSARDVQDAFIYNKKGAWNPLTIITDWVYGLLHAIRQDDVYWEWMSSGAAQSSAVSVDRNFTQSTLDKMTKTRAQRLKSPKFLLFDTMQKLAEFSELATRISNYQRIKKNLSNGGMKQLTMEDMLEAAYESRDLMDFARGGKASRVWNSVSVFANPAIQGWDKFYRTFKGLASKDKQERKEAMYAAARLVLGGMLPALVLTLMNWDKDWWKEIPDWQKDNHWIISDRFRIPKGQDIGIRFFSSLIEKGLDSMYNKNPMTAKRIMKPIYEQLPDLMPTAMMPILEAAANYSFFKQAPIVPQYQKDLPAKLQYSPFSSGFAKFLSETLSDKLDVSLSPRQIDHVLNGFGGNVSRGATGAADVVMGNKQLNTSIEEAPVFRGFMMIPYKNSATVDKFYKEYRKQVEGDKAFKATRERMEGYSPDKYKRMTQANKKMSELNKKERKLLDDNNISPARKQELQAGIQRQRIDIAKRAMGVR